MGIWTDLATWRGPTPNQGGQMTAHRGVVLHVAEGYYEGTVAWCLNQNSGISAHFIVAKNGAVTQLVDTDIQSWCQSAGNAEWLSIENEGFGGESLTAAQVAACARILARAHQVYGVPLAATDSPSGRGLGHHSMGGAAWGGHYSCPGSAIIAQKPDIVRSAGASTKGMSMIFVKNGNSVVLTDWNTWHDQSLPWSQCQAWIVAGVSMVDVTAAQMGAILALPAPRTAATTVEMTDEQAAAIATGAATVLSGTVSAIVEDAVEASVRKVLGALDGATP